MLTKGCIVRDDLCVLCVEKNESKGTQDNDRPVALAVYMLTKGCTQKHTSSAYLSVVFFLLSVSTHQQ